MRPRQDASGPRALAALAIAVIGALLPAARAARARPATAPRAE
jgi:hypothetical protein